MKKIIISGGGTGGHVFPAIAIANALERSGQDVEILFVGAEGRLEMEKVPAAGYRVIGLPVRGFRRRLTWENAAVVASLYRSLRAARRVVDDFRPDAVVGVGGYASGPVGWAATRAGVPLVLQEQNSLAGVTNRLLARRAARICVAYEGMERYFGKEKVILTGNPVREELPRAIHAREEGIAFHGLDARRKTVLVTGGSLGAASLNRAVSRWLERFAAWDDVQVLWQCGKGYSQGLERALRGTIPPNVILTPFLERVELAYACADVVVARAGACTISELTLLGKAAVLVPSPNVSGDHQTRNARALVDKGAAILLADGEVEARLADTLAALLADDGRRRDLSERARALGRPDASERIAGIILSVTNKN
ncbi:MAG: undecaprenyldiphospho-muramoylpentapeptide beta-N-acetylglucosaminyltransferase [Odoribacteraceae bacterium]|jgi:UDP-N-acetylglucosamine--N-acetylmuramyl-(pentapeptide) pyrophosphoryl-undecaprenol N-acetylglucosamine transferase|nr:undecaprenyldiphospho-muramoylpentapeptide beta-N-acetylglucosaminyltransferase [Odoribacteraceae bacterium]